MAQPLDGPTEGRRGNGAPGVLALVLLGNVLACTSPEERIGPPPAARPGPVTVASRGFLVEVNTGTREVRSRVDRPRTTGASGGPSFSILDGDVIGLETSNYSAGPVGAILPGMVRVHFDVSLSNRLESIALMPPNVLVDAGPATSLMLFPMMQEATVSSDPIYAGDDGSVIVETPGATPLVTASPDWDGGGTRGYDFALGRVCDPASVGCSRWESFAPLAPLESSTSRRVGFDVASSVGTFRVRLLLAADLESISGSAPPPPSPPPPGEFPGIPFGPFHLPAARIGSTFDGLLRNVVPSRIMLTLDSVRSRGGRVVLAVTRSYTINPDGTFNLTYWKWEVDRYRSLPLQPYLEDGTIIGLYVVDEPDCGPCYGGRTIAQATVEEMARYAKTIWPDILTIARVVPGWFDGPPGYLDVAWAQYEGPLHVPSAGMSPEDFRDRNVADAQARGLGLVFGLNVLDGGDGSSGITGTILHPTRSQMSAAEYERAGTVLAAAPYGCALIDWRYSIDYPGGGYTAAQLAAIKAFHTRSDVLAASSRIAAVARSRPTAPCRRR